MHRCSHINDSYYPWHPLSRHRSCERVRLSLKCSCGPRREPHCTGTCVQRRVTIDSDEASNAALSTRLLLNSAMPRLRCRSQPCGVSKAYKARTGLAVTLIAIIKIRAEAFYSFRLHT